MNYRNISSYYPAGQKILKKQGIGYNFDNFVDYFEDYIKPDELEVIKSNDTRRIENLKSSKVGIWAIIHIFFRISESVLIAISCCLVVTLPYYLLVQGGNSIIDIYLLKKFIIYAAIIFIVLIITTIILLIADKKLGVPLEAINLK